MWRQQNRPRARRAKQPATFRDWLAAHPITVPNVAGPRESQRPGVYAAAVRCLEPLLLKMRVVLPK
ncbi:MAG: Circularly permutated YpsA family [Proteobacteria bacterium]|nr:Circularly permutated YpsA family [Pseudomonadota bacterium]